MIGAEVYWLVWKGPITIFDHFGLLGAQGGGVKIELRGSFCLK